MRYAIQTSDGIELLNGSSPLPEGAIQPIPNWDDIINLPSYYLKLKAGQIVEKTAEEKQAWHDANPPTLDEVKQYAEDYLESTDWYIIRNAEIGSEIPTDISNERKQQRIFLGE